MNKVIPIIAAIGILIHISFYSAYAFNLEINEKAMDVFYAFGFHSFVLIAAIVFYNKIKNKIVGALSVYAIAFELVSFGSFFLIGLYYDKPYFYYKAALLLSIPLCIGFYILKKIIKYVRSHTF